MNTGDVYNLFRALIDEPDETFLSLGDAQTMLDMGYREFRQRVTSIDPEVYNSRVYVAASGKEIDLTGVLFGAAATNPAQRIIRIGVIDAAVTDNLAYYMTPCQTPVQVENREGDYCISGAKIVFGFDVSGTGMLRIEYIPENAIPKADWNSAGATFIDDLSAHHPLIALYAARYYSIRDGAMNNPLEAQRSQKEKELQEYLTVGRATDGSHYITPMIGYSKVVVI